MNLLANAIKFSHNRSDVHLNLSIDLRGKGEVLIDVIDEGIGIAPAECRNLFKPFFKSTDHKSKQKNPNGNGLGLSIC
jgi:signal transduction histidine kinase